MKILFINNWEMGNHLTQATSMPSLNVLVASALVDEVVLVTPEYTKVKNFTEMKKVKHYPIHLDRCTMPLGFKYICYEKQYRKMLKKLITLYHFDKIIARGTPAGGRAWWLHKLTGIPFYVESFEPHADYMFESNVWSKYDVRYLIQKYWEYGIVTYANGLMPVSNNYKNFLISKGIDSEKIHTIPCTVDIDSFSYHLKDRKNIRKNLGISLDSIVGIYVGKFGDIYYDDEAFNAFEVAFKHISNFELILLSPMKEHELRGRFSKYPLIKKDKVHLRFVEPLEVPHYLSASDFAYSFIKTTPSKAYCSPVKIGEYWANGLVIISSKGIGDDVDIIEKEQVGVIVDMDKEHNLETLQRILTLIKTQKREDIAQLAKIHRNRSKIIDGYKALGIIE